MEHAAYNPGLIVGLMRWEIEELRINFKGKKERKQISEQDWGLNLKAGKRNDISANVIH